VAIVLPDEFLRVYALYQIAQSTPSDISIMPIDRTHDISNTPYHVKDIEAVGHILNSAATAAFPNQGLSRYREVHALLLSWEDDDLGVVNEIAELEDVFQQIYRFEVDVWRIPSERSHIAVAGKVLGFLNDYESTDSLLIVYYGGHGSMNDDRQCVWSWYVHDARAFDHVL